MKFKIVIKGREIELTTEQARRLYDDLAQVFETKRLPDQTPSLPPIYIAPTIYPAPETPPLPFRPNEPWCGDNYPRVVYGSHTASLGHSMCGVG